MTLKLARAANHPRLTQQDVADLAGCHHTTISRLEADDRRYLVTGYATVVNIARVLGVEPDRLFPVPRPSRSAPRSRTQ
jgi:transcriptional regulator with XRE-family HTH domain